MHQLYSIDGRRRTDRWRRN